LTPEPPEKLTRRLKGKLKDLSQFVRQWFDRSRRKLATAAVGLLACLLGYHVVFGANGLVVYEQKRQEYRQLQEQNQSIQQQNQKLERQIKALKTDPQAIEKEARERLHYVRPGEVVYTLPAKPPDSPARPK
jgi:cell division protein FtsB